MYKNTQKLHQQRKTQKKWHVSTDCPVLRLISMYAIKDEPMMGQHLISLVWLDEM